ncbi:MAG: hypothetical protein ABI882_20965 [Acidobacteriota bacterium]
MNTISRLLLVVCLATIVLAQSPEPPLSDARLTIHTLVREDVFAGFLQGDLDRFARAEKNIQLLLEQRPAARSDLLAWKGGTQLYRAVRALEAKRTDEFRKTYAQALDQFAEAQKLAPEGDGVAAVVGGSLSLFADQLPVENRAAAWSQAYNSYQILWKHQAPAVDKLPVHIRGELLGGLAQSSQRTGRTEEMAKYVDKIIEVLPGTPYETMAKKWKQNPESAAKTSISCMTCHEGGRLAARVSMLNK